MYRLIRLRKHEVVPPEERRSEKHKLEPSKITPNASAGLD